MEGNTVAHLGAHTGSYNCMILAPIGNYHEPEIPHDTPRPTGYYHE